MCRGETYGRDVALAAGGRRAAGRPGEGRWRFRRCVRLAVPVLIVGLTGASCAPPPPRAIRSQVVDMRTGQPIAGAIVVGVWLKSAGGVPGMPQYAFTGLQEVETDARGWFELSRPQERGIRDERVTVYKFGYVAWNNVYLLTFPHYENRKDTSVPARIELEPFPPGESRRRHADFIREAILIMYSPDVIPKLWKAFEAEETIR